ncbi:MAG: ABC-F family ATP-binding cassette domain-containing protein [Euryarchaeota archaeon]|nr:ABC-F family ATP-binding cassette domain-containing protein [Euryarchaeota archaeon]
MSRQLISVEEISRSFGAVDVLSDVSFLVNEGDRIGIVGHNGAGKTTLLNTISEQKQDMGDIEFAEGLRIAYLTQVRDIEDDATIEEELARKGRQFLELEEEITAIELNMGKPEFYEGNWQPVLDRYAELQQMLASSGGANVALRAKAILERLGLSHHPMGTKVNKLSGGERAKLALARQLVGLDGIDMLFLDEPTNHLDIETTEWLEQFLRDFHGTMIMVSHDRYFLDQVCTRILEIENQMVWQYAGNYSKHLKQKIANAAALGDLINTLDKKIKHTLSGLQHMKRNNKYDKSISAKHKMIERMQKERKVLVARVPKQRKGLQFNLESVDKASLDVLELEAVYKRFDGLKKPILSNAELFINKGMKIGIVGGNGVGKTTLLKMINGDEEIDSGKLEVSPGVIIGYFHQDHRTLNFDLTPIKQIEKLRPDLDYGEVRAALGRFQFAKEQVDTQLQKLSGGERARVALLQLLLEENNLLLMDEPTNHLDVDAKESLEAALNQYDGSLMMVSHDRWFLDQTVNWILELKDGKLKMYKGNYSDYIAAR